ncbi:MAG: pyruvate kinase [Rhizobiales bacterium]|jgi:pyruvate kinase|nr:pyruvate kinase [Hyphomicrobiales bacterium]
MRRQRRTKIVATLGPASSEPATIEKLYQAGADVFRINMSHTPHEAMRAFVNTIRTIEERHGRPIGILADLQGPKLRLGAFRNGGVQLEAGATFVLDSDPAPGGEKRVHLPHPEILEALRPGHRLLIDDGKVKLTVTEAVHNRTVARVDVAGRVSDRKGVSLPDSILNMSALTPKDRGDLEACLEAGVDWIALSFIQRADDVAEAKKLVRGRAAVLSKIEKPQAIGALEGILELSDALMVARGDLGVEMPLERVPALQRKIIRASRRAGKPVVVATQMLESMITTPIPTRAEVSDVANAVYEGADAVMLSAESAAGAHPVLAVETMNRIAEEVERESEYFDGLAAQRVAPEATGADAISAAARQIAETLDLGAILCLTSSGATAMRVARERPKPPIIALSPKIETVRRLSLLWDAHCALMDDAKDIDITIKRACAVAFREGIVKVGQRVILVAGVPLGTPGATNMVRIAYISDEGNVD